MSTVLTPPQTRAEAPPGATIRGYDVVRSVLGLILLVASAAKGYELATGATLETSVLTSRWFLVGLVCFEALFGLWLLVGRFSKLTHRLAALCFAAFFVIALLQGLAGKASCGCFGRLPVSPWVAAAFDLAALTALVIWRPRQTQTASPLAINLFAPYLVGAVLLLGVLNSWAYFQFGSLTVALAYLRGNSIEVSPRSVDLGEATPGQVRSTSVQLVNLTDHPISIVGWNSTRCVGIPSLPLIVSPHAEQSLQLNLGFVGHAGPFTRRVVFYTDDKSQPAFEFWFSGRIHAPD